MGVAPQRQRWIGKIMAQDVVERDGAVNPWQSASNKMYLAKRSPGDVTADIIIYLIFGLITLVCVFPFYYIFINTISSNEIVSQGKVYFYPVEIQLSNYVSVFKIKGLGNAAIISVLRTVIGTFCTVFASGLLGFLFTKQHMFGRRFWYRFIIITMYFNAGLIPWYLTMYNLKLTDNFLAYILPVIVQPFFIILVKTYVESLPSSLQEAAEIDGAGNFKTFTSIILPLTKPILATITVFAAVNQWNSYIDTLLLMTKQELWSLQFILYKYINQANSLAAMLRNLNSVDPNMVKDIASRQTPESVRMTVTIIVVFPILIIYPLFQRFFIKGIMIGAIKG